MKKEIEERIDLAILANGGEVHKKEWCQCDPLVGQVPCEYCAIFNGLNEAKTLLTHISELAASKRRLIRATG